MPSYRYSAIGNGVRTDHPIPDLVFVDDAHIPIDDPHAIEAVGRHHGGDTWGRMDRVLVDGSDCGWIAFTTDPARHDLAWCVRWHPEHGRSVVLYRDEDSSSVHMSWWGPALLFRSGGYWWDGTTWYRPAQVWDAPREEFFNRAVPAAVTITAADLLSGTATPGHGRIVRVEEIGLPTKPADRWNDELALWASQRPTESRLLTECVVTVTAPELTGENLVGVAEMAEIAGVAASTLRAYITRDENQVPLPQAKVSGRSVWARAVAEEWAEQRRRSPEAVREALAASPAESQPPGVRDVWARFSRSFFSLLWERPDRRKRWALRWRTEEAVRDVAEGLGWEVAASLDQIIPMHDLPIAIRHAVLDELNFGLELNRSLAARDDEEGQDGAGAGGLELADDVAETDLPDGDPSDEFPQWQHFGITPSITKMLDWLIRHNPSSAQYTIGTIIGEADRRFGIPRHVTENSIRTALSLDGQLDTATREDFLARVFSPTDE